MREGSKHEVQWIRTQQELLSEHLTEGALYCDSMHLQIDIVILYYQNTKVLFTKPMVKPT